MANTRKHSFVVVSNRLPVSVSKEHGKLVFNPSSGGLATAMESLRGDSQDMLWVGWPGIASDELTPADKKSIIAELRKIGCAPVFLTADQVDKYYSGYANDTIWPLFHYFESYAQYNDEYWDAYRDVNRLFDQAIAEYADDAATIWVHDYHLMLLPALLRETLPNSSIGFFLHIPFPSYEIFRMLPNRQEILRGLLGADMLGFHVYDYARHFLSSALRILGLENSHGSIVLDDRTVKVDAFPIGIDYTKFTDTLKNTKTKREMKKIADHYKGQKIILSVDRLDYTKGIMKRLEAFELFLRENPKYLQKVTLMVVAVPSRTDVETYQDLRDALEQAIARVNGQYGTVDWVPVTYQYKNLPFEQIVALYAKSDIAMVTPIRDGMNLVAKEYVASKQQSPGVLILSEMAGAVDELPEALSINPNDIASIVAAMRRAMLMTTVEQTARMDSMQNRLSRYTVQRWAADFTDQLQRTKASQEQVNSKLLSPAQTAKLLSKAKKAESRLLLLDYDGTLREFVSGHAAHQAAPSQGLLVMLKNLADQPNTKVCIISGRTRQTLEMWFNGLPVTLVAEHGVWMKDGGDWSQADVSMGEYKKIVLPILEHYAERTPGARVEQKEFALVWHYRNVPTELAAARNASIKYELRQLLANTDIEVHSGNKIIEVKPRSINKGAAVQDLLAMYRADFVLCAGDDYTDEDMFRVVDENAVTIKVGLGDTAARYQLANVSQVLALLQRFAS